MKIDLHFKTPDVAYQAISDIPDEEKIAAEQAIGKFVRYGENVTIQIDTETGTAIVKPLTFRG
jgi:hypothetical protein